MKFQYISSVHLNEFNAPAQHVINTCKALVASGHEVSLLRPTDRLVGEEAVPWAHHDTRFWYPRQRGGWRLFEARVSRHIRRMVLDQTDVMYLRCNLSSKLASAIRDSDTQHCVKVLELNGKEGLSSPGVSAFLQTMDLVLVDTKEMRERVLRIPLRRYPRVALHFNSATDTSIFRPIEQRAARHRLNIPQDAKILIYVAGFQPHHDYNTVIEAFSRLTASDDRLRLLLLGDGPRRQEIQRQLNLRIPIGRFSMPGSVPPQLLATYIAASDICLDILSSERLRDGNLRSFKLYEYMACARPVIETVDFHRQIPNWAHDILALIPAESPVDLSNTVLQVLDRRDDWDVQCKLGREYVERARSWSSALRITLDQIEDVKH